MQLTRSYRFPAKNWTKNTRRQPFRPWLIAAHEYLKIVFTRLINSLTYFIFSRFRYSRHSRRYSSLATAAGRWLQFQSDSKIAGRFFSVEKLDNIRFKRHVVDFVTSWFRMVSVSSLFSLSSSWPQHLSLFDMRLKSMRMSELYQNKIARERLWATAPPRNSRATMRFPIVGLQPMLYDCKTTTFS